MALGEMISKITEIIDPVEKGGFSDYQAATSLEVKTVKHLKSGRLEAHIRDGCTAGATHIFIDCKVKQGKLVGGFGAQRYDTDGGMIEDSRNLSRDEVQGILEQYKLV